MSLLPPSFSEKLRKYKLHLRVYMGLNFIAVGIAHFISPEPFVSIVPPYLPAHYTLVYVSGFFEVLGGFGILLRSSRQIAAWGLLALLVAVYPANIHMLVNDVYIEGFPKLRIGLWLRMPLQFVFMAAIYWSCELKWPFEKSK